MLRKTAEQLQVGQPQRLLMSDQLELFHKCQHVIDQLKLYANGGVPVVEDEEEEEEVVDDEVNDGDDREEEEDHKSSQPPVVPTAPVAFPEFDIILDDPAGNSFIENLLAPHADPAMTHTKYVRTAMQDMSLGLQPSAQAIAAGTIDDQNPLHKNLLNGPLAALSATTATKEGGGEEGIHHRAVNVDEQLLQKKKKQRAPLDQPVDTTTTTTVATDTLDDDDNNDDNDDDDEVVGRQEVIKFITPCPHCFRDAETDMCVTDIPHFKEVIIMSLFCDSCGYKSNEIKGGGAIPKFGSRIIVTIRSDDDLGREVLKSDTAGIQIPELELELEEGGLDGMYTTMEGLMKKLYDRLKQANPFGSGDAATKQHLTNDTANAFSAPSPNHARYLQFLDRLYQMAHGQAFPFTVVLSDPLSNSFVGPIPHDAMSLALQAERDGNNECYNLYVDKGMVLEEYERSFEQNEVLGLNDMKTENYHEPEVDHHTASASNTDQQHHQQQQQSPTTNTMTYYGTDQPEEVPDRIRRVDIRGPDHPHAVGKAPVEGDTTVMGAGSVNFAVPAIAQRGTMVAATTTTTTGSPPPNADLFKENSNNDGDNNDDQDARLLRKLIHDWEYNDSAFMMNDAYEGTVKGMVYKDGAQGLGYYTDVPLLQLFEEYQQKHQHHHE